MIVFVCTAPRLMIMFALLGVCVCVCALGELDYEESSCDRLSDPHTHQYCQASVGYRVCASILRIDI